ncbi:carboxy-terminal kinesin 2-like [Mytilus trossulus]|uniref:carboxy-terminal kinesin 2-like n=1 Tax=Mytilus trossulus TaxID=6551 RepID=UPI00300419DD
MAMGNVSRRQQLEKEAYIMCVFVTVLSVLSSNCMSCFYLFGIIFILRLGLNNQKEKPKQRSNLKNVLNDPSIYDGRINSSISISADKSQENNTLETLIGQDKDQHDKSHKQQNNNEEEISRIKEALTTMNEKLQRDLFVNKQERDTLKQQLKSAEDKEQTRIILQLKQDSTLQEKDTEIMRLKQLLNKKNTEIENKNCDIRLHETERRKYHNRIQELKGNIRVFCRVRPLLGTETNEVISFPEHDREQKIIKLHKTEDAKVKAGKHLIKDHVFEFDKVFRGNAKQHQVFEELSQLVQSALDGYNVCIFAYGQTGSGKTYTMEGVSNDEIVNKGMIPRAVLHILDKTKEIESIGWKYILKMSFLEIYNETIRDLLGTEELKHDINMSDKGLYVSNLTVEPFTEETKVYNLLQRASNKRSVGKTTGNERSSRSHSVLTLQLIGENLITKERSNGTLNMVDLAGSESIDSEATPQRQEETKAINKSLSTLGNVIMALGNGAGHIPYRNSKLTKLLQNSLGGNSKTLMFVNVSPTKKCDKESLTSLRFAEKVNQCTIGIATKT